MWLWWVVSLIILIASIALALYIYYSSYKTTPQKNTPEVRNYFKPPFKFSPVTKQQVISSLKLKLQAVENNSALYYNELKKLQERIKTIENNSSLKSANKSSAFDENWEELYYETHEQKEKLENELDALTQTMEAAEQKLQEATSKEKILIEKQSDLETQLNKAHSLQNKIGELQREIEGAAVREAELKKELEAQKQLIEDFELLQQQYAHLQSEAEELQNRMIEMKNQEISSKQKINRLNELESTLEVSDYEKMDIKKSIEEIIIENEALASKLQELQEKLNSEKYA